MTIIKIGSVELTEKEAFKLYAEGKYIVTYSRIYQLHYSDAQQRVYGTVIHRANKGENFVARGRFHCVNASEVNRLARVELVKS